MIHVRSAALCPDMTVPRQVKCVNEVDQHTSPSPPYTPLHALDLQVDHINEVDLHASQSPLTLSCHQCPASRCCPLSPEIPIANSLAHLLPVASPRFPFSPPSSKPKQDFLRFLAQENTSLSPLLHILRLPATPSYNLSCPVKF